MMRRRISNHGSVLTQAILLFAVILVMAGVIFIIPEGDTQTEPPSRRIRAAAHVGLLRIQTALRNGTITRLVRSANSYTLQPIRLDRQESMILEECSPIQIRMFLLAPVKAESKWTLAIARAVALDKDGIEINDSAWACLAVLDQNYAIRGWQEANLETNEDGTYRLLDCSLTGLSPPEFSDGP